jgi:hypothetical protein
VFSTGEDADGEVWDIVGIELYSIGFDGDVECAVAFDW